MERADRLRLLQRRRRLRTARKFVIVACVAAAVVQVARSNQIPQVRLPAAAPTVTTRSDTGDEWRNVLAALDDCRQELFRSRIKSRIDDCDAPGSAAWRSDSRALERAIAQDVQIESLPLVLIAAQPLARRWSDANEYVQLLVRDRLAQNSVRIAGQELQIAARSDAEWLVTLRRSRPAGQWRYFEVRPKPAGKAS